MNGTMRLDDRGYVIETGYTLSTQPILLISRYRVNVMNGRPSKDSESVTFNGTFWSGYGFQCNTEQMPESTEQIAINKPRGAKVYRDGEWRKR